MRVGTSNFIIRWINFLTMVCLMLCAFGYCSGSVWVVDEHSSRWLSKVTDLADIRTWSIHLLNIRSRFLGCFQKQFHTVMGIAVSDHAVLRLGRDSGFTVLAFIVTNNGSGHSVAGLRYKEYQFQDYSSWFLKQLNNSHNWERLRHCLVKSEDCSNLSKKYKTLKQYKLAKLTAIEAGCCRPPSQCGYPAVNASYYDLSFHPVSPNNDCRRYKNSWATKCYDCDSCKAGVAQYMKTEWRVVAIFNVVLFLVLTMIYFVGCCARRNAARSHLKA